MSSSAHFRMHEVVTVASDETCIAMVASTRITTTPEDVFSSKFSSKTKSFLSLYCVVLVSSFPLLTPRRRFIYYKQRERTRLFMWGRRISFDRLVLAHLKFALALWVY